MLDSICMVIRLLEIVITFLAIAGPITQIMIPAAYGTRKFPLFRKRERELVNTLLDVRQENAEHALEQQILQEKKDLS